MFRAFFITADYWRHHHTPQFLTTQTIKITVVKTTIPKPKSVPHTPPSHLLTPSPTPTKLSPSNTPPRAKKELFKSPNP